MARTKNFGQISGRFLELSAKTLVPEPYSVTDKISVDPPTKRRGEQMQAAANSLGVLQQMLDGAMFRASEPKPAPLDKPGSDAPDHDFAAWKWCSAEQEHQWQERVNVAAAQMVDSSAKVRETIDDYNKAFFGDAFDDVMEFFTDQPQALWDAFVEDIKAHFAPHAPTVDDDEDEDGGEGK